MWGPLATVVGGNILGSAVNAFTKANAEKRAAQIQADAARRNTELQQRIYEESTGRMKPFYEQGLAAGRSLAEFLPQLTRRYDYDAYMESPEYLQQQLAEEELLGQARSMPGTAGMLTPGVLAALRKQGGLNALRNYQQGEAGYWGQNQNIFNMLYPLATSGQNAAVNMAGAGQNMANQVSAQTGVEAQARARGIFGQSDAWSQGMEDINKQLMGGLGAFNQNRLFQQSLGGGGMVPQSGLRFFPRYAPPESVNAFTGATSPIDVNRMYAYNKALSLL